MMERYNRHIVLPQIGEEGQQRLSEAKVLLVGVGGLGSAVPCIWQLPVSDGWD